MGEEREKFGKKANDEPDVEAHKFGKKANDEPGDEAEDDDARRRGAQVGQEVGQPLFRGPGQAAPPGPLVFCGKTGPLPSRLESMGAGRERSVSYSSTGHGPPQPGVIRALRGSPLARSLTESREHDRRAVLSSGSGSRVPSDVR